MLAALLLFIVAVVAVLLALLVSDQPEPPDDPTGATQVELHRIRLRVDVAWLEHQARSDAIRMRRDIDRELGER